MTPQQELLRTTVSDEMLRLINAGSLKHYPRIMHLRQQIAQGFGDLFGWHWMADTSPWQTLFGRKARGPIEVPDNADHHGHFINGKHVMALVEQPYAHKPGQYEKRIGGMTQWATQRGLMLTVPGCWPSWWYPGRTTLCVITKPEIAEQITEIMKAP